LQLSDVPCKKGSFTKQEVGKIQAAIEMYQKVRIPSRLVCFSHAPTTIQENDLDDEQLDDLIHSTKPAKGFWSYVGPCLQLAHR
jgi:hypothetical protein